MIIRSLILLVIVTGAFSSTHPAGLPEDEFARRRAIFMDELRDLDACAILHSAPSLERNAGIDYPYRQDSDLIYMTGWEGARCILLLLPRDKDTNEPEVILFVDPRDPKREVWTGPQPGLEEASLLPEIHRAMNYDDFFSELPHLSKGYDRWVVSFGNDKGFESALLESRSNIRPTIPILQDAPALIRYQRLIKSEWEIASLERAIKITGASLKDAWKRIPSLHFEYEAQAEIEYGFLKRGAKRLGFPSIVGAGKNATYLHYEANDDSLRPGELLLLDVGAEWNYYSADISRTIPMNGTFSPEQKAIYEIVLNAQEAAIATIRPGVSWRQPHETAIRSITQGLADLGLLQGEIDSLIANKTYRKFFMHGTSHWLGLDTHDAGGYTDDEKNIHKLKAGMVLTVEPGIYISETADIDPKWWNIGVRIEDDILVTRKGFRILSRDIPKTITEIEAIMQP